MVGARRTVGRTGTPRPLPNVGGTVSLSWGGNGPPPPAPLALNSVGATLVDHGASDRYELLAHRAGAAVNAAAGAEIVALSPAGARVPRDARHPQRRAGRLLGRALSRCRCGPLERVPNLDAASLAWAPLVPQDSHFALHFAHPVADQAGFAGRSAHRMEWRS